MAAYLALGVFLICGVDAGLQRMRSAKDDDPTRGDRNLHSRLGVSSHSLSLLANGKGAERGDFYCLATSERHGDFVQHRRDKRRRFVLGQTDLSVNRFRDVHTSKIPARQRFLKFLGTLRVIQNLVNDTRTQCGLS